jgi:hypothetical protein
MYVVKNMAYGLSNHEAVLNMQRHIAEYGPIYVSFLTTDKFMSWDWDKKPVYTGGGSVLGGHAVIAIGWGTDSGLNYWLLRNSWGTSYNDHGHMKFERGKNLDKIEESESTASMPVSDYDDWSAPYCELTSFLYEYSYSGSKLLDFPAKLKLVCSKDADVTLFASNRMNHRDDIYDGGIYGDFKSVNAQANHEHTVEINMICREFGLQEGVMWINIESKDQSGNVGKNDHFLTVPKVQGMTTSAPCR